MGWTPEEKHFKLSFEGAEEYEGLEVTVREISVGDLMELAELTAAVEKLKDAEKAQAIMRLFTMIGDALVSWNLEIPAGKPVPADANGVKRQPLSFILTVTYAWISAMAEVDIPLQSGSKSGETSPERSLGMDALSQSHGS